MIRDIPFCDEVVVEGSRYRGDGLILHVSRLHWGQYGDLHDRLFRALRPLPVPDPTAFLMSNQYPRRQPGMRNSTTAACPTITTGSAT